MSFNARSTAGMPPLAMNDPVRVVIYPKCKGDFVAVAVIMRDDIQH